MLFNTPMILGYVLAALAGVPALINAVALDNNGALANATSEDLPTPTCYTRTSAGFCTDYIKEYCAGVSQLTFKAGDNDRRCYGGLSIQSTKYKCNIGLSNTNANQNGTPNEANCVAVLENIAKSCHSGGYAKYSQTNTFLFKIYNDPRDSGVCKGADKDL